jgi:predicted metalloprotease
MSDDGISPQFGHVFTGDQQQVEANAYTDIANTGSPVFVDAPSDSANVVTPAAGVTATEVWKRIYRQHTNLQEYKLVFYKGQTITDADIANASTDPLQGTH